MGGRTQQKLASLLIVLTYYLARGAYNQRAIGNYRASFNQRIGAYNAVATHFGAI
jgi:hypothetical protein